MTLFKRPIPLKSLTALLLILLFGSAILLLGYYILSYKTSKEISALKLEIVQLDQDIESLSTQKVRLSKAPIPSKEELYNYATMVPKDREVARFLTELDSIVKSSNLQLLSLQINENQPITTDLLDKLLVFLEERSESLPSLTNHEQREDFIGDLLAQMDDQYRVPTNNSGNQGNVAPIDDGPLKRVILHIEYSATDAQLYQFLSQVQQLNRMTYVDNMNYDTAVGGLDLTIFYYEGDYPFIPKL